MAYATRTDIEDIFGEDNVQEWADVNNNRDQEKIKSRINEALTYAENKLNGRLRFGPYAIPLTEPVDPIITDMTARLAGSWLYGSRALVDADLESENPMKGHMQKVDKMVRAIHGCQLKLMGQEYHATTYPESF